MHGNNAALQKIDTSIHDWAVSERTSGATTFFTIMTIIGGPLGLAVLLTVIGIILAIRRRWRWLIYLAVTAGGGALLNLELKRYFARARPIAAEMLRRANGYSFPSGHAMGSAVAFGALAYLAFRAIRAGRPNGGHGVLLHARRLDRPLPRLPRRPLDFGRARRRHRRNGLGDDDDGRVRNAATNPAIAGGKAEVREERPS